MSDALEIHRHGLALEVDFLCPLISSGVLHSVKAGHCYAIYIHSSMCLTVSRRDACAPLLYGKTFPTYSRPEDVAEMCIKLNGLSTFRRFCPEKHYTPGAIFILSKSMITIT